MAPRPAYTMLAIGLFLGGQSTVLGLHDRFSHGLGRSNPKVRKRSPVVILLPDDCSRSNVLTTIVKGLLIAHGETVLEHDYSDDVWADHDPRTVTPAQKIAAVKQLQHKAAQRGKTLLLKTSVLDYKVPEQAELLHNMSARLILAMEYNSLDVQVCAIADCFEHAEAGHMVDVKTRTRLSRGEECFRGEGELRNEGSPMVWMNVTYLRDYLDNYHNKTEGACELGRFIDECSSDNFYYISALLEHEYDSSDEALARSVSRWEGLLQHLRQKPVSSTIAQVLQEFRNDEPREYEAQEWRISNLNEVETALADTSWKHLVRRHRCGASTCGPEGASPMQWHSKKVPADITADGWLAMGASVVSRFKQMLKLTP